MNDLKSSYCTKNIIKIALPIMMGNLAQTIITLVDTAFLGHVGRVELSAAMMAGLYYYVFSTLAWGFSVGIQIIIARRYGEQKITQIGEVFDHGLLVIAVLSALLFTILHFFTDIFLVKIISSPTIYAAAQSFMDYRHYGIIFVCFNFLFRAFYIGLTNTRVILYTTLLMAGVNIFFDYGLIFGNIGLPRMGVAGAATASVMAEVSALLFFIIYTLKQRYGERFDILSFKRLAIRQMGSIVSLSLPTMAQRLISFGMWFLFFIFIERLGEEAISVSSIVRSIYMLMLVPAFAFGTTANTLTSRLIGEGGAMQVGALLRKIMGISLGFIAVCVAACLLFPEQWAALYTEDQLLLEATLPVLYIICGATILQSISAVYFEAVSGTGNTLAAFLMESSVLVIYVGYTYWATIINPLPITWVWGSEYVYAILLMGVSLLYLRSSHWRKKSI